MRGESEGELVFGVHPVTELLESRGAEVDRIYVVRGRHTKLGRLLRSARQLGVPVTHLERDVLARKVGRQAVHQGVAARMAARSYLPVETLIEAAGESEILVLVDRVTDPRNLGAILRTSAAAGVGGVLLSAADTVGLTPVAVKASAGTAARLKVAREARPGRRLESLATEGFEALALDARGESLWEAEIPPGRCIFVAGGEEAGASEGVLRRCSRRLAVPLAAGVESLNVAVALGVLLFEARRRRSGCRS